MKTALEVESLFRNIYVHIQNIPAKGIEEAVILVSYT